jgi:small-conductance mechanosensitive channel
MKLQEIRHAIKFGSFTNDELNTLSDAIRFARTELVHEVKRGLSIGDNVTFTSSRTGKDVTGVVEKIAVKYVTVRTVEGGWRVPANMLSPV